MIEFYFALRVIVPIVVLLLCVLMVVIFAIKRIVESKFRQNCYECKHYQLFDVASCGNGCRYKCGLKGRYDNHNINNGIHFVKCKEFEQKRRKGI